MIAFMSSKTGPSPDRKIVLLGKMKQRAGTSVAYCSFSLPYFWPGHCLACEFETDKGVPAKAATAVRVVSAVTAPQADGGQWKMMKNMNSARQEIATAVLDGKIYVIGGLEVLGEEPNSPPRASTIVEAYNPATNTWATRQDLPGPNHHNSAAVAAGRLYSFGGLSKATFVYDPVNNSWSRVADSLYAHGNTAAVGVMDDKIYVAGGESDLTMLEVYDPATNTWSARASMSVGRHHCAGGVIDGKFYVAGGRGTGGASTALEVYNPQTNSWSRLANMPTGRSGIAAGVVNGELYVFGGEVGGVHPEVEAYNPATNSWRREQDMPVPRHGIWASVIGNKIYLPAGAVTENYFPTSYHDAFVVNIPTTFANISTRLNVGTGDNALIGGFIVTGTGTKRIIVRAIGPSVPLAGTLANPHLELYNARRAVDCFERQLAGCAEQTTDHR